MLGTCCSFDSNPRGSKVLRRNSSISLSFMLKMEQSTEETLSEALEAFSFLAFDLERALGTAAQFGCFLSLLMKLMRSSVFTSVRGCPLRVMGGCSDSKTPFLFGDPPFPLCAIQHQHFWQMQFLQHVFSRSAFCSFHFCTSASFQQFSLISLTLFSSPSIPFLQWLRMMLILCSAQISLWKIVRCHHERSSLRFSEITNSEAMKFNGSTHSSITLKSTLTQSTKQLYISLASETALGVMLFDFGSVLVRFFLMISWRSYRLSTQ